LSQQRATARGEEVGLGTTEIGDARSWLIAAERASTLAAVFKALSDPTRLRLISLLTHREFCVGDLAAALDASQSVVSHQLRDMRRMGWVRNRREGRHVYYALDDEHVRSLFEQAMAHTQDL
jgi:ArsR family transcriptional regulator, lead/cadmium/zinc/bismuth-responsive transcriptional repressor